MEPGDAEPCELLSWDTDFWRKRIARVRDATLGRVDDVDAWARAHDIDCLFFLGSVDDPVSARAAEDAGFRLMDVRVELERPAERGPIAPGVREARPDEVGQLRKIASSSHGITRFYADPKFPDDRCDEFYETWIESSLQGWAAGVLVAQGDDGPVGYVSCHLANAVGSIGLIAVGSPARGGGLGVALSQSAVAWCAERGAERMTVATQARNVAALRTFGKTGFLVTSVAFWFHKWYR